MAELGQRFARLAAVVREERKQIALIVDEAEEARLAFLETTPDRLALRGIGAILHDFYTEIEHLFERIAPELNGGVPAGSAWHRDLLQSMTLELEGVRPWSSDPRPH